MWLVLAFILVPAITLLIKVLHFASTKRNIPKRSKTKDAVSILAVMGSGGHTREMISLVNALGGHYSPRYFVIAETDKMSEHKIQKMESSNSKIIYIPRSREVKQSYATSILSTIWAVLFSVPLVFRLRPDVILCNGPGTCIPICFAGLLLKVTGCHNTTIVYVESFCRVTSLSLSGKLLYYVIDEFFVQWPELKDKYPHAKYVGRII
ncbi:UDP-n-acetylglucosamine transferase subunit alg14-like protein [Plakobranchus ocellatus]|uniref:UDP-N-acetylglucosamine transferase subunit ALG14 n=1 Tax=Plakobranchus ocellatus TaxID=259542 RepID=A0AAV4BKU0_9GAST|nr:UDP-n-acetylglucosamine transferase subunit alg14-like protein [Plakobranchus ocellatus]